MNRLTVSPPPAAPCAAALLMLMLPIRCQRWIEPARIVATGLISLLFRKGLVPIHAATLHLKPDVLVFVSSVKLLRLRIAGAGVCVPSGFMFNPLAVDTLQTIDACWRAVSCLSGVRKRLQNNPLIERRRTLADEVHFSRIDERDQCELVFACDQIAGQDRCSKNFKDLL